jgi:hypothetical protein
MNIRPLSLLGCLFVTSAIVACSAAPATIPAAEKEQTKSTPKKDTDPTNPSPAAPAPGPGTGTGTTPAPKTQAEAQQCMTTCFAGTASAAFGACVLPCKDEQCGQTCFEQNCKGKEDQCETDDEKCFTQCGGSGEEPKPPTQGETQCLDTCFAGTPGAAYWTCSSKCEDDKCGEACFTSNCSGKEQQCDDADEKCFTQCFPGEGADK